MSHLAEIALFTPHVDRTAAFYRALLGSEPIAQSEDMAVFLSERVRIFIHKTYTPEGQDLPPENHVAFAVPDVDLACEAMKRQGATVSFEPRDYYWGRSAYLRDPDGHLIELTQTTGNSNE